MPGTNDLVVWERVGKNYQFDKAPGVATKTLILDLSAKVQEWGDCGLMADAFHPDFTTNRYDFTTIRTARRAQAGGPVSQPPAASDRLTKLSA